MRVLLPSPAWPPQSSANGIVTYVGALREGLTALGVDVRVLVRQVRAPFDDAGVVHPRPSTSHYAAFRARMRERILTRVTRWDAVSFRVADKIEAGLRALAPGFTPDLIEMEESFGTAEIVRRRTGIPVVVRLHGPWFLNGSAVGAPEDARFRRRVRQEGLAIARAMAVTSPSRDLLEQVRRHYEIALPTAKVIPNPGPAVSPAKLWSLAGCDPNLVLFVGRFDRHKGGDLAIDAFASLAATRPNLRLAFVGPDRGLQAGGERIGIQAYLRERVTDSSVRSRIEVLGQLSRSEIEPLRRRARATIVASRFEVFGMVVAEALAFGCPLVAPRTGGIPELVAHERNGLLFESGDANGLAHALAAVLCSTDLSGRLGARAAADARSQFVPEVVAHRTREVYEELLSSRRR